MKNRARIITAFLLCACLLVGVGYAPVTGQLLVTGTSTFNGMSELTNEVKASVVFTGGEAIENCTNAGIVGTTSKSADMTVVINDAKGNAEKFTAVAVYTIKYDTTESYPEVTFAVPNATVTETSGSTGKWGIEAIFEDDDAEGAVSGVIVGNKVTLAPGESVKVRVTVTFDNATGEIFKEQSKATITVLLDYNTIE